MKRTVLIVGCVVLLIALLAGAAYVAGRYLKATDPSGEGTAITMGSGGGTSYQVVDIETERAEELPNRPADVSGLLTRIEGNSIYIGMGVRRDLSFSAEGSDDYDASDFDAIVEVVVTRDTAMYRDVTGIQMLGPGEKLDVIRQKVAPLPLDDVGGQALILAWGNRRGDRLIADVLLCRIGC